MYIVKAKWSKVFIHFDTYTYIIVHIKDIIMMPEDTQIFTLLTKCILQNYDTYHQPVHDATSCIQCSWTPMQESLDKQHPMLEIWYIVNICQETFVDKQSM